MGDLLMNKLDNKVNPEANILLVMEDSLSYQQQQYKDLNPEYSEFCKMTREWIKLLKKAYCAKQ